MCRTLKAQTIFEIIKECILSSLVKLGLSFDGANNMSGVNNEGSFYEK